MTISLLDLFQTMWMVLHEASLYIIFGLFFSGILQMFVSQQQIAKHLGPSKFKSVLLAALGGIPLPLCSCGVIPAAMALRKKGASRGATLSFLISTPETGIDSVLLSFALLDPIMAVFRPLAAFVSAIMAGILNNICVADQEKVSFEIVEEKSCCHTTNHPNLSVSVKFKEGMRFAFVDLLKDIGGWFSLGIVLAGLVTYFVPTSFIENNLSDGWSAMFIVLLAGIPLYICASGSTPVAAALIMKGMSPGVALVFLLVGPATNVATILMVWRFLGKQSMFVYLFTIAVSALLFGYFLNYFYGIFNLDVQATLGHGAHIVPDIIKTGAAFVFISLMLNAFIQTRKKPCH